MAGMSPQFLAQEVSLISWEGWQSGLSASSHSTLDSNRPKPRDRDIEFHAERVEGWTSSTAGSRCSSVTKKCFSPLVPQLRFPLLHCLPRLPLLVTKILDSSSPQLFK